MISRSLLATCLAASCCLHAAEPAKPAVDPAHSAKMAKGIDLFKKQVRGVFAKHCLLCHGGETVESDFNLNDREQLLKGGALGPAIELGNAKDSLLYKLVLRTEEPYMPHEGSKLPEAELAAIAEWINLGAPYDAPLVEAKGPSVPWTEKVIAEDAKKYWAFQPLSKSAPPVVQDAGWAKTPIDRFILAKLEAAKIKPNAIADRRTLIRRTYFDLLGLPPTPDEVDAFVNDAKPDAYDRLIDRLLANPHFGERWARHWLDVVRYAESHGFEHDYDRPYAYHYRDFVIRAFNNDLPFDKFVRWQIAGDEYEPDNPEARMATGFLGAGVHATQITAATAEKERYDELDDITRTLGTAMLGMTIGCARCHDHKFDPIPSRDYHRIMATFTTTVRSDVDIDLDPASYRKAKEKYDAEHAPLVDELTRYERESLESKFASWLVKPTPSAVPVDWTVLDPTTFKATGGGKFTKLPDGSLLVEGNHGDWDTYTVTARLNPAKLAALRIEAIPHPSLPRSGPGRADSGGFYLGELRVAAKAVDSKSKEKPKSQPLTLAAPVATSEEPNSPAKSAIDGDPTTGWGIGADVGRDHAIAFRVADGEPLPATVDLTFTFEFRANVKNALGRFRIAIATDPAAKLDGQAITPAAQALLARVQSKGANDLKSEERTTLFDWYRRQNADWLALSAKVGKHAESAPRPNLIRAMVCGEGLKPIRLHSQGPDFYEKTHFLKRGDVVQKEGEASPGFLQVMVNAPEDRWQKPAPTDAKTPQRRKALAEWIADVDHGAGRLLARVIVNRLWQHHLGRGIVATPGDFGIQGDRPSHPELLDWLASELIASGWSLKHVHRLILTSAVYMQGDQYDAARSKADVSNKLWWRRTPMRLEAEIVRDSMLAVSGKLDEKMFGPGTLNPAQSRRSIYFFVKRSKLVPMMVLFDAPDALGPLDARPSTTIAPQSLLVMNNPVVLSYADGVARRSAPDDKTTDEQALTEAYRWTLGRKPTETELKAGLGFIAAQSESYRADQKSDARRLALADFCQMMFGLNEFLYID